MIQNQSIVPLTVIIFLFSTLTLAGESPVKPGQATEAESPASHILALLAVHGQALAGAGWERIRSAVNRGWVADRLADAEDAIENPTPERCVRARRMRDGEKVATFGVAYAGDLRNVLYIRLEFDLGLELEDLIDLDIYQNITDAQFEELLEGLIQRADLQRIVEMDLPRYVGIVLDAAETGRDMFDRMNEEERETDYHPDRRQSQWNRNFVVYQQPLAHNLPVARAKELEGIAIRRLRAQLDCGQNSNAGKRANKRAKGVLQEICGHSNIQKRDDDHFDPGGPSRHGLVNF